MYLLTSQYKMSGMQTKKTKKSSLFAHISFRGIYFEL